MNPVIALLHSQRTTRAAQFGDQPVEPALLDAVKSAALKTPNASNRQSYSVIVLDRDHAAALGLPGTAAFVFCIDFHRLGRCAETLGREFDGGYFMQFATALTDISMLAQSCILAAQSLGIDTLLTNQLYHGKLDKAFNLLGLPGKGVFPLLALCMGYAERDPKPPKGRLDPSTVFHDNAYREMDEGEIISLIEGYDCGDMGLIPDWAQKGYAHYLEWFFDKWCPAVGSRRQSEQMERAMKEHGMI